MLPIFWRSSRSIISRLCLLSGPAVHLWSDLKDVLYSLRDQPSTWITLVANRTSNIKTLLPQAYCHYVGTLDNSADVASRGIDPELMSSHNLWFFGPLFLEDHFATWNSCTEDIVINPPIEEKKVVLPSTTINRDWSILERFSTFKSVLRFTSIYIRILLHIFNRLGEKTNENKNV